MCVWANGQPNADGSPVGYQARGQWERWYHEQGDPTDSESEYEEGDKHRDYWRERNWRSWGEVCNDGKLQHPEQKEDATVDKKTRNTVRPNIEE